MSAATESTKVILDADDRTRAAFESARRSLDKLNAAGISVGGMLSTLGVGALSGGALIGFVKSSLDAADNLNDLAAKTQTSVAALASLKLIAEQSGTGLDDVGKGINRLSVFMAQSADEARRLGITAKDPVQAFLQFADALEKAATPQDRAAIANKVLGKSYQDLMPLLAEGSAAIRDSAEASRAYAEKMALLAPEADKFNDSLAELKQNASILGVNLGASLAPALNDIVMAMNAAAAESGLLKAAWVGLGGVGYNLFNGTEIAQAKERLKEIEADLPRLRDSLKKTVFTGGETGQGWLDAIIPDIQMNGAARSNLDKRIRAMEAEAAELRTRIYGDTGSRAAKKPEGDPLRFDDLFNEDDAGKIQSAMRRAFDTTPLDDFVRTFATKRQAIVAEYDRLNAELTRGKAGEATSALDLMGELGAGRAALASGDAAGAKLSAERGKEMLRSLTDAGVIGAEGTYYVRTLREYELSLVAAEEKTALATASALTAALDRAKTEIAALDPIAVPIAAEAMAGELRRVVQVVREELSRNPLVVPVEARWGGGAQENIVGDTLRRAALARGGR